MVVAHRFALKSWLYAHVAPLSMLYHDPWNYQLHNNTLWTKRLRWTLCLLLLSRGRSPGGLVVRYKRNDRLLLAAAASGWFLFIPAKNIFRSIMCRHPRGSWSSAGSESTRTPHPISSTCLRARAVCAVDTERVAVYSAEKKKAKKNDGENRIGFGLLVRERAHDRGHHKQRPLPLSSIRRHGNDAACPSWIKNPQAVLGAQLLRADALRSPSPVSLSLSLELREKW